MEGKKPFNSSGPRATKRHEELAAEQRDSLVIQKARRFSLEKRGPAMSDCELYQISNKSPTW
jgi:hypothetical protein